MDKKIWVVGGDLRQLTAAKLFSNDGYEVYLYGFDNEQCESDLKRASEADIIVLPMPVSTDDIHLNAPHFKDKIALNSIAECIKTSAIVFGGQIREGFADILKKYGIKYCDYLKREELSVKNAVPTALMI